MEYKEEDKLKKTDGNSETKWKELLWNGLWEYVKLFCDKVLLSALY